MSLSGLSFSYLCPLNKKIWSPTFVLVSCGTFVVIFAPLIWIIDIKEHKKWTTFFKVFGVNAIFSYLVGTVITIVMMNIKVLYDGKMISLTEYLYNSLFKHIISPYFGSLLYAAIFVLIVWTLSYSLYKNKVFIKL